MCNDLVKVLSGNQESLSILTQLQPQMSKAPRGTSLQRVVVFHLVLTSLKGGLDTSESYGS